ncbi:hypothetical protein B7D52_23125 [Klebsiella pneumoniae]|nr:hypothetical protein [Klebsiella pneumoniae]UNC67918.1 hypothetical protein B7D52_23125 [Klebsiella pneumoniae]
MAKHSGCPAKGKRPPSNAFLHDVCLTASPYPACGSSTGSNSVGPRKRSAAGRYTSDTVPAVVPDGGINALSGLRVPHRFKQRRPAQAQRRRAIHIRYRTRGCAGWRHKCLIRPAGPPQVQTAQARASAAPPGDTHQTPYLRLCRMAA